MSVASLRDHKNPRHQSAVDPGSGPIGARHKASLCHPCLTASTIDVARRSSVLFGFQLGGCTARL